MSKINYKKTLLYVDDEKNNLLVFRSTFRRYYQVLTAISAKEGLELLQKNDIQVVITDQRMPEMTGVEFLEIVQAEYPNIIKMILTGYSDIDVVIEGVNNAKIFGYISKPWNNSELKSRIDAAFENYHLKMEKTLLIEQLAETLLELESFLYRASHDLKTPITSMVGIIQLMKQEVLNPNLKNYVHHFENSTSLMKRTLDTLTIFNETIQLEVNNEAVDIDSLIDEVIQVFYPKIDVLKFQWTKNNLVDKVFYSDVHSLKNLLKLLIDNCIVFYDKSKDEHRFDIKIEVKDKHIILTITDNGIGISEDIKAKVFDMFYRGSEQSKGVGLGLYVARKIVEKLEGEIVIESSAGEGTSVICTFPLEVDSDQ